MLPLLAHQGGWDEILMFVGPIVAAFFIVRGLERKGRSAPEDQDEESQNTVP